MQVFPLLSLQNNVLYFQQQRAVKLGKKELWWRGRYVMSSSGEDGWLELFTSSLEGEMEWVLYVRVLWACAHKHVFSQRGQSHYKTKMCGWCNKQGTNPWEKYLRWDSNMLLNSVYTPKFTEITPKACRVPCATDCGIVGTAVYKTVCDKATMWTAPWRAALVEWIGADLGIKTCFPVVITKATESCSPLSKANQAKVICGNSTWSIYFVICSDKEPNWGRFSWRHLLMGLSTQGSGVGQEMAHLSHSSSFLKWRGWMHSSLLCQPPCPNTAWATVACATVELCLRVLGPQQSRFSELCVFRFLPEGFVGSH